ncbi:MAG TPA: hypothetical protein GX687_03605 [Clostridia bacterium]|jgi:hypothetical protein|nr:hypothetical protein [Clostridia bacterium]
MLEFFRSPLKSKATKQAVTITYNGPLAQSDVPIIYAHVGTGVNEQWENIKDIKMEKEGTAWQAELIPQDEQINFCFHDGAGNWDNNYGLNWSLNLDKNG